MGRLPDIHLEADLLPPSSTQVEVSVAQESDAGRAFRAIYDENFAFVWRCLRSLGVPPAALDDAAQDVFLVVHRRLASYRTEGALRTWLFGIVRNVAANVRRSLKRRGGQEPLDTEPASPEPGPLQRAEDAEIARFVHQFVGRLSDAKRDIFVLGVLEELAIPEVAPMLGIPLNTAYTRLRSVRLDFQRALERARKAER